MITLSVACSFAAYDLVDKKLTTSIVTIDNFTSIVCNADEPKVNGHAIFCADCETLVTKLKSYGAKNIDGSEIALISMK